MTEVIATHRSISLCRSEDDGGYVCCNDGAMCVPVLPDGSVIFITEPTIYDHAPTLLLPGGGMHAGESPAETANRELQEEAGYKAEKLDYLGELRIWAKYLDASAHVLLARQLIPSRLQGDETHPIPLERIPLTDIETLIAAGRLQDASVIAALYMARSFIEREVLSAEE